MRLRLICLFMICHPLFADWRDDSGYTALQTELGPALPSGAGISVMLSEANATALPAITYLPQATVGTAPYPGTGSFVGKTFTPHSGASTASNHALQVAGVFFGIGQSMAPGVTDVHAWLADDFIDEIYFNSPPSSFAGSVQNHSWAGGSPDDAVNTEILRRLDYMVARDGVIAITPMNNGSTMTKLAANAFHSISVGLRDGNHPHTQSNVDVLGRMKPDLVVNQSLTSLAGPGVASAAAMLLETVRASHPDADDPRVMKALLIAAASKQNLPGWQRAANNKPYDTSFGAGELNVRNAYHILVAGRQMASDSTERSPQGWNDGISTTAAPQRYFFRVPAGRWANTFSAAITWHRQFSSGVAIATLANLDLRLKNASGFVVGSTVDQSISAIDNVEHLFLRNLPAGQYVLEVSADTDNESFGIAWEAQLGTGPTLVLQRSGTMNTLALTQLDPFKTYTVKSSTNLSDWTPATTIRTADTTAATTAQWSESSTADGKFYRLDW